MACNIPMTSYKARPPQLVGSFVSSFEQLTEIRENWDEAVIALKGSIYMSYDWVRTWWEFYGANHTLRLFVFREKERIVGIVPMYIDALGFGPLHLRVARLVCANIPPKVFTPPIQQEFAVQIFERILEQLLGTDNCGVVSFGPVSELQNITEPLKRACNHRFDLVGRIGMSSDVHTIFELPSNMEEYYASLSKNERKNRRKYELRLLSKEFETRVEVLSAPEKVEQEFEKFSEQHTLQWRYEGKTGHFGAWPRALEFNRALVRAQGKLNRLRFIRIVANGEVIANQYTFAFGDEYYWELPSRVVGAKWERFSLGPTGIVTMIQHGIEEGKARLHGGLAHYDYKLRLGAKEYKAFTFRIVRSTCGARMKLAIFSFFSLCLKLAYHRIWFRRIAPRLPSYFWRPQWTTWLRFDF
jgi:hypothetical protein